MTILLQIDIFHLVLEHLGLKEVIQIRRVCVQWRDWIDAYLARQETLVICELESFWNIAKFEQTMGLNVDKLMTSRLDIYEKDLADRSFAGSVVRLMPNIKELFVISEADYDDVKNIDYVTFLTGWKELRKLMVAHIWEEIGEKVIDCLNALPDLETFIILNDIPEENPFIDGKEDFLRRLKTLYVQDTYWIEHLDKAPTLTSFGLDCLSSKENLEKELNLDRFPALERLHLDMNFQKPESWLPGRSNISNITNCLERLLDLNFDKRLMAFEFVDYFTLPAIENKTIYHKFFQQMNHFEKAKSLKFHVESISFLDCLLQHSENFRFAETLHILYRPRTLITLPENLRNFFPKKMKNIKEIRIRACMKRDRELLTKIDFSKLPYKVKIKECLFDNFLESNGPFYW